MFSTAYSLGMKAKREGRWFHETLDNYLAAGIFGREDMLDFYEGYWGDGWDIVYENGRISIINKDRTRH